jgi:hypothetical protein
VSKRRNNFSIPGPQAVSVPYQYAAQNHPTEVVAQMAQVNLIVLAQGETSGGV